MPEERNIQEQLRIWADEAIATFNPLSESTNTLYYQQSPLNEINEPIDTLIIGINPGSSGSGSKKTAEEFLRGNSEWKNRFDGSHVSKKWHKFFGEAHYFICQDYICHSNGFDDDKKTVWTNLTPFATAKAASLKNEHYAKSLPFIARLIEILCPQRIILLGSGAFNLLENYAKVEHIPLVRDNYSNMTMEVGRINGTSSIQVPHPSRDWGFPKFFIPIFVAMHRRFDVNGKSLAEISKIMRNEISQWLSRIELI